MFCRGRRYLVWQRFVRTGAVVAGHACLCSACLSSDIQLEMAHCEW
uniref:Uncharacterized protein n=1 Tax=Arundo donax TaxID=35708 RepID=A0A0A9H0Y1_ARUDO